MASAQGLFYCFYQMTEMFFFFFLGCGSMKEVALNSFVNGQSLEAVVRESPLCVGFSHIPQGSLFSLGFVWIFLIIYWFMYGS